MIDQEQIGDDTEQEEVKESSAPELISNRNELIIEHSGFKVALASSDCDMETIVGFAYAIRDNFFDQKKKNPQSYLKWNST